MSVESGFKTFRGNDGLWEDYPVEQVATHEGWVANPTLVNNFYNNLRKSSMQPSLTRVIALSRNLKKTNDVTVITQMLTTFTRKLALQGYPSTWRTDKGMLK